MEIEAELTEWDAICRICLQEGEMHSIFDYIDDNTDLDIASRIMICSSIEIKRGVNLPEQICTECLSDLDVAYRFHTNCERSDAILQSFVDSSVEVINEVAETQETVRIRQHTDDGSVVVNADGGAVYEYKPPVGLNVKRFKPDAVTESSDRSNTPKFSSIILKSEPYFDSDGVIDDDPMVVETLSDSESRNDFELSVVKKARASHKETANKRPVQAKNRQSTVISALKTKENPSKSNNKSSVKRQNSDELSNALRIEPVKVNKARLGFSNKKTAETGNDGIEDMKGEENLMVVKKKDQKSPKVCDICGNSYKYQHALDSHMRRHRNIKPYQCMVCGKGFVINFELNRHMRTHTGQKPYACKYCERRFSDFGSRVKHERTHTGERPYACGTCGKTFAYSHVLSSHNLIHTGEKKYHCDICGKRFAKSHHLKAHLNTHSKHKTPKASEYITGDTIIPGSQSDTNENDLTEYINVSSLDSKNIITVRINEDGSTEPLSDQNSNDEQLILYSDVAVLTPLKNDNISEKRKFDGAHIIEDENGVRHEITIEEQQDAIELLTFEDDQLE